MSESERRLAKAVESGARRSPTLLGNIRSFTLLATASLLLVTGLAVEVFVLADSLDAGENWDWMKTIDAKQLQVISLGLAGLISIWLAVERLMYSASLEKKFQEIEKMRLSLASIDNKNKMTEKFIQTLENRLRHALPFALLPNKEAVYREATDIIRSAEGGDEIRATSFGEDATTRQDGGFERYIGAIAERMSQVQSGAEKAAQVRYKLLISGMENVQRTQGESIENGSDRIILRLDSSAAPKAAEAISKNAYEAVMFRLAALEKHKVTFAMFEPAIVDTGWSLDLLQVRDEIIIGFPTFAGERFIAKGIKIKDPRLAKEIRLWFNDLFGQQARRLKIEKVDKG